MKKRLFFDMDNVLVNFQSGLDKVDESIKEQYRAKTPDEKDRLDEIPGLFSLMEPMDGAVDAVHKLAEVYDVFILSTAPWNNPSAWSDKVEWVKKYFGEVFYKRMVITHRKDLCEGDYLIDDRGKNGTSEFKGEWIHFGSERFPNWESVKSYLIEKQKENNQIETTKEKDIVQETPKESCLKRCLSNLFSDRNKFSSIAWVLLLLGEISAFFWIRGDLFIWGGWSFGTIAFGLLILILWGIGQLCHHKFKVRSVILTRLLANAIAPQKIGTIYLVLFVIHIGWLTNAVMCLFTDDCFPKVFATIGVCIVGTIILIAFFPNRKGKNRNALTNIVISGISPVFQENDFEMFNLIPFVRVFQKIKADRIIVVLSDIFVKNGYQSPVVYVTEEQKKKEPAKYASFTEIGTTEKTKGKYIIQLGSIKGITRNVNDIKKDLEQVIKQTAHMEFYNDKDISNVIDTCKIEFTDFLADYNNFQSSFNDLNELSQSLDTSENKLYFNLTPGTVTMSSVMTLIAVDGDRSLYYYSQDKVVPIELKLREVNKNQIPLENLLSQALENVVKSE